VADPKPNILYIHSHDTGRYIQPYGHAIETPKLQRLAEDGVLFRKAFCANPTCSPSRACLLTGMWAHNNGMVALAHRGGRLSDYGQHIANVLKANGYATALAGTQHVAQDRNEIGYEHFLDDIDIGDVPDGQERVARQAAAFIAEDHDKPFLLTCGFGVTHRTGGDMQWHNGDASPLGEPRYCVPPAPIPETPETRRDFADFKVAANRLDRYMGIVFDALDEAGLRENTLVICTTDHGIAYPFMKCNLLDHGLGVMLIMRGPDGFTGGKVVDGMVSHIDVFPTVCEAVGIEPPEWLQGKSVLPLVAGETDAVNDAIFAEVNYHAAYEPKRCVRTERYKYIHRFEVLPHPILPNCDDSISKDLLLQHGWRQKPQEEERLFDLLFDPNEACNRVSDPAYAEPLQEMRDRLLCWMQETDDPLLRGPVPAWPGSVVNPVDGLSPQAQTERVTLSG